jgi:hypothetical protein
LRACGSRRDEGASPFFPPVHEGVETAAPDLQGILYRSPWLYGLSRSRWRLKDVREVVPYLKHPRRGKPISLPGLCKLLKRLRVCYKRGRASVHSPDLLYDQKMAYIRSLRARNQRDPKRYPVLYQDEFTFYRRARVSRLWSGVGKRSAQQAKQGHRTNTKARVAACLDVHSGQLIWRMRSRYPVKDMYRFFFFVAQHYPEAERIFIVLDNWSVHFHPYVLEHLQKQCPNVELVPLPTYAPWANPMEKVWHKLYGDVLDQHPFVDHWQQLKQAVQHWLEQYAHGSQELLHFVGLLPELIC